MKKVISVWKNIQLSYNLCAYINIIKYIFIEYIELQSSLHNKQKSLRKANTGNIWLKTLFYITVLCKEI